MNFYLNKLFLLATISRPRFWLYVAGPYLLGAAAGSPTFYQHPGFYALAVFFALPANLFLYGINDYHDHDTDRLNPKKQSTEHLLTTDERPMLRVVLSCTAALYFLCAFWLHNLVTSALLLFLLFLSYAYSAPPLRFKQRPFIDSLSNGLYVLPGVTGYYAYAGHLPAWNILLAGVLWAAAMHLFSAIPDIESDRRADLTTSAVYLGETRALLMCSLLWTLSFASVADTLFTIAPWSIPLIVYPLLPLYILRKRKNVLEKYWWFPFINAVNGALLFFGILFSH